MKASPKSSPRGKDFKSEETHPSLKGGDGGRPKFQLITAVALCIFGCALLVAGFCSPPMGEIHHSVLIAFGEILTFSGSLIGIDYHYRYKE